MVQNYICLQNGGSKPPPYICILPLALFANLCYTIHKKGGDGMVKKFKPNMMTTFMFAMLHLIIPFSFAFPIEFYILDPDRYTTAEFLCMIPLVWGILALLLILCCVLNLLTFPFTKKTVVVHDRYFSYQNTNIKYSDVARIEFDAGVIHRHGGNEPCCLDFYANNDDLVLSIDHPSLIMTLLLIRRCKTAKVRYRQFKQFIWMCAFVWIVCIVLGICGAYGVEF